MTDGEFETEQILTTVLRVLNEANVQGGPAMTNLIEKRVICDDALADHPTIQVGFGPRGGGLRRAIGPLGVINGLVEALTGRRVMAVYDETGQFVVEFREWKDQS